MYNSLAVDEPFRSTMALSELSAGHISRNGRAVETPPNSYRSASRKQTGLFPTPGDGARATLLSTPASVQSMLKNGTEIGDVGGLAFNLGPRALPVQRTPSRSHSNTRFRGPSSNNGNPNSPAFIYRNRSQASSQTRSRTPSRGPDSEDGRSYALMHSSFTSRNVPRHPTHINGHLRSLGNPRGLRPTSPLAYPTRLKRPGYRPSSPALTECYESGSRSPLGLHRGTSFRTASPFPLYDARIAPSLWAQGGNRSDPQLGGNRIPESGRIDDGQYVEVSRHRRGDYPGTYAHIPSLVHQVSPRFGISPAQQQPASPSPPPLFYDYSEDFQQNNGPRAPVHQGSGPRHRGVKDEYGRNYKDPTRVFAPDEHGFASPIKSQSQGMTASSLTQADNSALNREILTADTREHMRLVADDDSDLESDNGTSDAVSAGDAILHDRSMPEVEEADAAVSTPQSSGDHAADTVERAQKFPSQLDLASSPTQHCRHLSHEFLKPVADAPKFSFESERDYVKRLSGQGTLANSSYLTGQDHSQVVVRRRRSRNQHSEIHAPVPRRSVSSPSNRDRFSSILSIDEGSSQSVLISHNLGLSEPAAHLQHEHPGFDDVTKVDLAESDTGVEAGPAKSAEAMFSTAQGARSWSNAVSLQSATTEHVNGSGVSGNELQASGPRNMKKLPSLPRNSVISVAPPPNRDTTSLPFSFTPLRPDAKTEEESVAELGNIAASYLDHLDRLGSDTPKLTSKYDSKAGTRYWKEVPTNLKGDFNAGSEQASQARQENPDQEAASPKTTTDAAALTSSKSSRFKLKLNRSSTSTTSSIRITKPRPSVESGIRKGTSSTRQRLSTSNDVFQSTPLGKKLRPNPLTFDAPGQINTSRTSPIPLNTRFVESFDLPAQDFRFHGAPSITLVPPSPGLNIEARSFFSDDSSQTRLKGSLRKRLSQFKATVTRASTSDEARGIDRALLGSAMGQTRNNGRSSRRSDHSQGRAAKSHPGDPARWRFIEKVKAWYLRLVAKKTHVQAPKTEI